MTIEKGDLSATHSFKIDPKNIRPASAYPLWLVIGVDGGQVTGFDHDADDETDDVNVPVLPALVEIQDTASSTVKEITTRTPEIREIDGETVTVDVKITLTGKASSGGAFVKLQLEEIAGEREEDYIVRVSSFTIDEGESEKTVPIEITTYNEVAGEVDEDASFKILASVGDTTPKELTITIDDAEEETANIRLVADPYELYEGDGGEDGDIPVDVKITTVLDGAPFEKAVAVILDIDGNAARDVDYDITRPTLLIPAGDVETEHTITITPKPDSDDTKQETDGEKITLGGGNAKNPDDVTKEIEIDGEKIAIGTVDITLKNGSDPAKEEDDEEERIPLLYRYLTRIETISPSRARLARTWRRYCRQRRLWTKTPM